MNISPYEPNMAEEAAAVYNRAIASVPHCFPVTGEEFGRGIADAESDRALGWLRDQTLLVASEGGAVRGLVHSAVARLPEDEGGEEQGVIRFFWHEPGRRAVGQALLAAAEAGLREQAQSEVIVGRHRFGYPFYYVESAYISDRLGHVQALLQSNGYRKCCGEVILDWPDFEPPEPAPTGLAAEVVTEWKQGRGARPGVTVRAVLDGQEIGMCRFVSLGEYSSADEAQDWAFTEWLGVGAQYQGKGLGRHLLLSGLREMHQAGYRHACITTDWQNYRAFVFYTNCGYHVVDWTYGFRRELG